jgi:serine/threonine protein kinase
MKGSGYISSGSYGCVNNPPVKCEGNTDRTGEYYKNSVGKYFSKVSSAVEEYDIYEIIQKIDPQNSWTLPLYKKCLVSDFKKKDNVDRCEHYTDKNITYMQLIYKNGGIDLYSVIDKYYDSKPDEKRDEFLKIFSLLKPIIEGLKNLNDSGYSHLDIKPGNILYDGKKVYVIDFGLLLKNENIFRDKNERYLLFEYPFYPAEFKLYGCWLRREKKQPLYHIFTQLFKKNIDIDLHRNYWKNELDNQLSRFYSLTCYNTENFTKIKKIEKEFLNFNSKIDIYSLGITLLELYNSLVSKDNFNTLLIRNLLEKMINVNPYERISWDMLIREYEIIGKSEKIFRNLPTKKKKLKA